MGHCEPAPIVLKYKIMDAIQYSTGFIQANLNKIQGLFKDFSSLSYSFQGLKVTKNPELSVKLLLQKC